MDLTSQVTDLLCCRTAPGSFLIGDKDKRNLCCRGQGGRRFGRYAVAH